MPSRRRTVRLLLSAAVLWGLTAPAAHAAPTTPDGGRAARTVPLRVATYNIHAGAGMDNVFDLDRQTAAIRAMDADVVGLEEVDVHWGDRSRWRDVATELGERLHMHVYFAPIYSLDPPAAGAPRREFGVAVLSRYRFLAAENHEITRLSTQDPHPVPAPAPGFPEVVVRAGGVPVHVYVTHLDYRPDPAVRAAQVADMDRIMAQDCDAHGRCPRQILVGDFNAEPGAPELAPLWAGLQDAGPATGQGTYPALNPEKRIDFVTASRDGVAVRDVTVPDTLASDHRPVVADLVLRRGR
jgi:endonuclease/exonuclease/phosphatase family metal-dependent hydrolase